MSTWFSTVLNNIFLKGLFSQKAYPGGTMRAPSLLAHKLLPQRPGGLEDDMNVAWRVIGNAHFAKLSPFCWHSSFDVRLVVDGVAEDILDGPAPYYQEGGLDDGIGVAWARVGNAQFAVLRPLSLAYKSHITVSMSAWSSIVLKKIFLIAPPPMASRAGCRRCRRKHRSCWAGRWALTCVTRVSWAESRFMATRCLSRRSCMRGEALGESKKKFLNI